MASRPVRATTPNVNANPHPLKILRDFDSEPVARRLRHRIEQRAYEIYQQGGSQPGGELRNWLSAERDVLKRLNQVRESGPWVVVNLELQHTPPDGITILMENRRAIIAIEEPQIARRRGVPEGDSSVSYFCAEWPGVIDPASASAYVKSGVLTLEAKKAMGTSSA